MKYPSWGHLGAPILPSSLRSHFADLSCPRWLQVALQLNSNDMVSSLCEPVMPGSKDKLPPKMLRYAERLFAQEKDVFEDVVAIGKMWPSELSPELIGWSNRTRNALLSKGIFSSRQKLSEITFGELLNIPGVGVRSCLDFAASAEAAIAIIEEHQAELAGKKEVLLLFHELGKVLHEDWVYQVNGDDPRFSFLFDWPDKTSSFGDLIEQVAEDADVYLASKLRKALPEVRKQLGVIDDQNLEESLVYLFTKISEIEGKRFDALFARFGWNGDEPITLEAAGKKLGVTRERIRQIELKLRNKTLAGFKPYLPALDKALEEIESVTPISFLDAMSLLKDKCISNKLFHPKSLIAAASDLGRMTSLRVKKVKGSTILLAKLDDRLVKKLISKARSLCGASGATNVLELLDSLEFSIEDKDEERVRRLLNNVAEISFLTKDWFWVPSIPEGRNRLENLSRRMLSVTNLISVDKIREGLKREYFFRNSSNRWNLRVPPRAVLQHFYEQHQDFELHEDNTVSHRKALDYKLELGGLNQALVEIIRSSPSSLLDRNTIRERCQQRGLNMNSLEMALSYNCIVEHLGSSLYTLRGVNVNPAAIQAHREAISERPSVKRVLDHEWNEKGNLVISVRVPTFQHSFVFGAPGAVRRFINGKKFEGYTEKGVYVGMVTVTEEGAIIGAPPFLRRSGADEGDVLQIEFDNLGKKAHFSLVGEN